MSDKPIVTVRECMNTRFDVLDEMQTIREALTCLQNPENKCAIVQKRDEHDEYGLLSLADVGRQVLAQGRSPDRVNVYEVAQKPVISVHADMDVRYCARLFERHRLPRAPVVEQNGSTGVEVIGIVAFTHLVMRGMIKHRAL